MLCHKKPTLNIENILHIYCLRFRSNTDVCQKFIFKALDKSGEISFLISRLGKVANTEKKKYVWYLCSRPLILRKFISKLVITFNKYLINQIRMIIFLDKRNRYYERFDFVQNCLISTLIVTFLFFICNFKSIHVEIYRFRIGYK